MSRLFPERVVVRLAPAEVTIGAERLECDPAYGSEPWQGALAALKTIAFKNRTQATVVLGNALVRYALVPWSDALATAAEEEAYIRHHFAKIHGERAKAWAVRASEGPAGAPRLASAIDSTLLEALKAHFSAQKRVRLVSVQPELMHQFNARRGRLPAKGAWLVMAEPERACVALHVGGAWRAVQNGRGAWRTLLERERHRIDAEVSEVVMLSGEAATA